MSINRLIEEHYATLLDACALFLKRAGLLDSIKPADLLAEVTIEAMKNPERLTEVREPLAWLMGIASNLIRRKQARFYRFDSREMLVGDFYQSDEDFFDRIAELANPDPAREFETRSTVDYWLSCLSADDRQIVELAVLRHMDGKAVAAELGISPGAARMRLHRALKRLKSVLMENFYHE
ncbi:MAG: sigma-70 family RNA polymerase sigma factor [Chloroflexi bacterium]|nr:sigma-70 family RNA polymerase sigma factor [Chloroflexota bacterium]